MLDMRFDRRVAVITGAGRGLGRAYALLLAAKGARVVVNDPGGALTGDGGNGDIAEKVAAEIHAAGGEAIANTDSVATPEGGAAIVQAALDAWGRIDVLVHNAGNVRYGALRDLSVDDFEAVLSVHLRGAFHVLRAAHPAMCDAGYGRIVLTSSIGGIYGNLRVGNYAAAKAGILGLANVAALEGEAHGVRCNVIVPSAVTRMAEGIDTSRYPPMEPALVAPAVGWLCHEACTLNGEILAAIGGRVARMFVAETPGVYQPAWTMEEIDARMGEIVAGKPLDFGLHGHIDHITHSFTMATGRGPSSA